MANKRISELTTITGANLADADLLVVVDVSDTTMASSGTNKKVTLNEFAQDSTFSSRYKPLASDTLWIDAGSLLVTSGSPSTGTLGNATDVQSRTGVMLFDGAVTEIVTAMFVWPPGWITANAALWWSNAGAGAGDVTWVINYLALSDGNSTDAAGTAVLGATVTAPAQYGVKRSLTTSTLTATAGQLVRMMVRRSGAVAGDTLANDAGVLGIELVRAS